MLRERTHTTNVCPCEMALQWNFTCFWSSHAMFCTWSALSWFSYKMSVCFRREHIPYQTQILLMSWFLHKQTKLYYHPPLVQPGQCWGQSVWSRIRSASFQSQTNLVPPSVWELSNVWYYKHCLTEWYSEVLPVILSLNDGHSVSHH